MDNNDNKGTDQSKIRVGMWGPGESGKTTYLATLYHACQENENWSIFEIDGPSKKFVNDSYRRMYVKGEFPAPTSSIEPSQYTFGVTCKVGGVLRRRREISFTLEVHDAAGEVFDDYENWAKMHPSDATDPLKQLASCDGILFMVDPNPRFVQKRLAIVEATSENISLRRQPLPDEVEMGYSSPDQVHDTEAPLSYFEIINDFLFALRRIKQPAQVSRQHLAVVFSKMDIPDYYPFRDRPEEFAKQVLGQKIMRMLQNSFSGDRVEFFSSSSVGVFQDNSGQVRSNWEPFTDRKGKLNSRIVNPQHIQPFGVFEPLEWLLGKLG